MARSRSSAWSGAPASGQERSRWHSSVWRLSSISKSWTLLDEVGGVASAEHVEIGADLQLGLELDEVPADQVARAHVLVVEDGRPHRLVADDPDQDVAAVQVAVGTAAEHARDRFAPAAAGADPVARAHRGRPRVPGPSASPSGPAIVQGT